MVYFSVQSNHIQILLGSMVLTVLLHFSSLHNHDKNQCFRNELRNPRSKTQQHIEPKQLYWLCSTRNPSNSIWGNSKNKNVKTLNNKSIYVENLVFVAFKSILRILYFFCLLMTVSYLYYPIVY